MNEAHPTSDERRPGLVTDRRGAVYVEFLIAFLPVLTMFLGLVQVADLTQANLIVQHAAQMATRAAVVVLPDDPQFYEDAPVNHFDGKRKEAIYKAASIPLSASRSISEVKVSLISGPGAQDSLQDVQRDDLIRVGVWARYECRVPIVRHLVCSASSGLRTLRSEAALPNQGASYQY